MLPISIAALVYAASESVTWTLVTFGVLGILGVFHSRKVTIDYDDIDTLVCKLILYTGPADIQLKGKLDKQTYDRIKTLMGSDLVTKCPVSSEPSCN